MQSNTLTIVGYETECACEHCGRALRHGIRLNDGRTVGAQCFDRVLTKPRSYYGKAFRVGQENIVRYAKIAARFTTEQAEIRFGIGLSHRTFEAA